MDAKNTIKKDRLRGKRRNQAAFSCFFQKWQVKETAQEMKTEEVEIKNV